MIRMPEGWPFAVAHGRRAGFRTILAPQFLVDRGRAELLSVRIGSGGATAGEPHVVEIHDADAGRLTVTATVSQPTDRELGGISADGVVASDEHGRPLTMLYGVVVADRLRGPLARADLVRARADALRSYQRFLADEDGFAVDGAASFALAPVAAARSGRRAAVAVAVAVASGGGAVAVVATTSGDERDLAIYSSLPRRGDGRGRAADVDRGVRMALRMAGGKAGGHRVRYRPLDDATAAAGGWDRAAVARNARTAAADGAAVAYIGELDAPAGAVAIPILRRALLAQLSPTSSPDELTTGSGRPSSDGRRNVVRLVPDDRRQGAALAGIMRSDRCARAAVLDGGVGGLARFVAAALRRERVTIVLRETLAVPARAMSAARAAPRQSGLAAVAALRPDCVVFTGTDLRPAVGAVTALARSLPAARLYGPAGLADAHFLDPARGGIPSVVAERMQLTLPAPAAARSTAPGRLFLRRFANAYPNVTPGPWAIYGYEAMRLALSAIAKAAGDERRDVMQALLATRDRRSALGTYSINGLGSTTLEDFARFAIRDGEVRFVSMIATSR